MGDAIRSVLLDPNSVMSPVTETFLYAAARAEHVKRIILPALESGKIVVCDRFVDASIAYQGYGMASADMTPEVVREINAHALQGVSPDLTMIVDVPEEVAEQRLMERSVHSGKDRIEQRGSQFFQRVRAGLRHIYEQEQHRMKWIDATESPEVVEQTIWRLVSQLINGVEGSPCN